MSKVSNDVMQGEFKDHENSINIHLLNGIFKMINKEFSKYLDFLVPLF